MKGNITRYMRFIEQIDPEKRSIRQILIDTLKQASTFEDAAEMLGITRQTFSSWWYRLQCEEEIEIEVA